METLISKSYGGAQTRLILPKVKDVAGVTGDNRSTRLVFKLPKPYATGWSKYIEFNCTVERDGQEIYPSYLLDENDSFLIPYEIASNGGEIEYNLKFVSSDGTVVEKSEMSTIYFRTTTFGTDAVPEPTIDVLTYLANNAYCSVSYQDGTSEGSTEPSLPVLTFTPMNEGGNVDTVTLNVPYLDAHGHILKTFIDSEITVEVAHISSPNELTSLTQAQVPDMAIIDDESAQGQSYYMDLYMLVGDDPTTLSNWYLVHTDNPQFNSISANSTDFTSLAVTGNGHITGELTIDTDVKTPMIVGNGTNPNNLEIHGNTTVKNGGLTVQEGTLSTKSITDNGEVVSVSKNIQASGKTITASTFSGDLSGNATTATTAQDYDTTTGSIKNKFDEKIDTAGTGLSKSGTTLNHSNSIATGSKGSATAIPVISWDSEGHLTSVSSKTVYPPTSVGSPGQIWKSDGSGAGQWSNLEGTSPITVTNTDSTHTTITHNTSGVGAGEYTKVTVDALGHVTNGTFLSESDIPTLGISKTDGLQDALNGKAPTNHASSNTTYGVGSDSNYGHVKFKDSITSQSTPGATISEQGIKDFVNSSIEAVAAYYITYTQAGDPYPTVADLKGATIANEHLWSAGSPRTPTKNDYAIVVADETKITYTEYDAYTQFTTTAQYVGHYVIQTNGGEHYELVTNANHDTLSNPAINPGTTKAYEQIIPSTRYIYPQIVDAQNPYNGNLWQFQYSFNMQYTDAQMKALNSGITNVKVNRYDTHVDDSKIHVPSNTTAGQVLTSNTNGQASWENVTANNPSLSWGAESTIGTIAGTTFKVTMPANPDTDRYVVQTLNSDDASRPLLFSTALTNYTGTDVTNKTFRNNSIYVNPSTGTVYATAFNGAIGSTSNNVGTDTKPIKLVNGVPTAVTNDLVDTATAQTITGYKTVSVPNSINGMIFTNQRVIFKNPDLAGITSTSGLQDATTQYLCFSTSESSVRVLGTIGYVQETNGDGRILLRARRYSNTNSQELNVWSLASGGGYATAPNRSYADAVTTAGASDVITKAHLESDITIDGIKTFTRGTSSGLTIIKRVGGDASSATTNATLSFHTNVGQRGNINNWESGTFVSTQMSAVGNSTQYIAIYTNKSDNTAWATTPFRPYASTVSTSGASDILTRAHVPDLISANVGNGQISLTSSRGTAIDNFTVNQSSGKNIVLPASSTQYQNQSLTFALQSTPDFSDYPYMASKSITGLTADMYASVTYDDTQVSSGQYAPFCQTLAGEVRLYAKSDVGAQTIPTISVGMDDSSAQQSMSNFVTLDGDQDIAGVKTFTKNILVNSSTSSTYPRIVLKNSKVTRGGFPSTRQYSVINFVDSTGGESASTATRLGEIYVLNSTAGTNYLRNVIYDVVSGNTAQTELIYDSNDNKYLTAPARTYNSSNIDDVVTIGTLKVATDVVHTTGNETIAGTKTFTYQPWVSLNLNPIYNMNVLSLGFDETNASSSVSGFSFFRKGTYSGRFAETVEGTTGLTTIDLMVKSNDTTAGTEGRLQIYENNDHSFGIRFWNGSAWITLA